MVSVEWCTSTDTVPYEKAIAAMEARVAAILAGTAPELVWLLEHPPVYTAGSSARPEDLVDAGGIPVLASGRGGAYTFHGPGQRVAYILLNLSRRRRDVRLHVQRLQQWLIAAMSEFGVGGETRPDRVGVWIDRGGGRDDKIGAIGVRLRRWVSYHGASLNVAPDLAAYRGIIPCGIRGHGVTSLRELGVGASLRDVDRALEKHFAGVFDD